MAYVIAEPCIGMKDAACVDACPVDCIHPKKDEAKFANEELIYIDPVECIDCGACVPVCPVSAIFAIDDLPEKWVELRPDATPLTSSGRLTAGSGRLNIRLPDFHFAMIRTGAWSLALRALSSSPR